MIKKKDSLLIYSLHSILIWGCTPILWSYLPVYMDDISYDAIQIGIIMAISPLMAILSQPYFGMLADKAHSKNRVFMFLIGGTITSILLFPISSAFAYAFIVGIFLSIFQSALVPISESITLERLESSGKHYGPIRLAGTFGFAFSSIAASALIQREIGYLFYLTAFIGFLNLLLMAKIPTVVGHGIHGRNISIKELFKDKHLTVFLIFTLIAMMAMSYFLTYSPIYFLNIGGTKSQLGWLFFISAVSELPFLLNAEKIVKKLSIDGALGASMVIIGLRSLLLVFIKDSAWMFPLALLNGGTFIVFTYSLAVYINKTVKKELRTRGQSVLGVFSSVRRILGALSGGFIMDAAGMQNTMLISFIICGTAVIWFVFAILKLRKKRQGLTISGINGIL